MRARTVAMRCSVMVAAALLGLAGCECEGAGEQAGATGETAEGTAGGAGARRPPPIGTTEEGEQIVFGPGVPTSRREAYREDRLVRTPNAPDPDGGHFTLEQAVEGMPIDGELVAEINTDFGTIFCDLHADRVPNTVAHFIGLARGRRAWWDPRAGQWRRTPYYRGLEFHRVIPGYMIQGGDSLADGSGTIGVTIPYEPHETLSHDRIGMLALATSGDPIDPDSGGGQIYITDGPAPQLDGTATIFGTCRPDHVISEIARVPQSGSPDNRPLTPIRMARVLIQRVRGGAAQARITTPQLPPGEPEVGRGASPDPSALGTPEALRRRREEAARRIQEELEQEQQGGGR